MTDEIRELTDAYFAWLKDKTSLRQIEEWTEITTPFLDRHNDYIQLFAKKMDQGFLLTDDRYTLEDLEQSGCHLDSPKRQQLLRSTLNGFGIQLQDMALSVHAFADNFALRKHNLIQAILAVNDFFYLASPMVSSLFWEDVGAWLDHCDIRFTPNVKFNGKSGYDHLYDFVIPKSRKQPERIIKTINHPDRTNMERLAFSWQDTRDVRHPDSRAFAFLNDAEQVVPSAIVEALQHYDIKPVPWSQRELVRDELAA